MRRIYLILLGIWLCGGFAWAARADTYQLTDGQSVTGDIVSYNEAGVILRLGENKYSNRILWTKFSQQALQQLDKNPKLKPLVDPFIVTSASQSKAPPIHIHKVSRLAFPARQSLLAAMGSSSVGLLVLLLVYAANLFAAYEIAFFRARPFGLVLGVAAVLPVLGPITFLAMPTRVQPAPEPLVEAEAPAPFSVPGVTAPAAASGAPAAAGSVPSVPTEGQGPSEGGGLHIASAPAEPAAPLPPTQVFQRGQYTFNRRFIETKFSGFFSMVRRSAEKDLVMTAKTMRGTYVVNRITRIAANDVHFEVVKGPASHEVMVPFAEIQEIQLKHKDA